MSGDDFELLDALYGVGDDGEARLQVGDATSGTGVGQDCMFLSTDGFIGLPNPPDALGNGQVVAWTPGNDRLVVASLDGRYSGKAGTLVPGDRAIVSNCDSYFLLKQATDTITLASTGISLELNGPAGKITASTALGNVVLGPNSVGAAWVPGGGLNVALNLDSSGASLSCFSSAGLASIVLGSDGSVVIIAVPGAGGSPSGVKVNGVALIVP
jgi:hypothetical protein